MNELYIASRIRSGVHFVMTPKTKWDLKLEYSLYSKIHTEPSTLPENYTECVLELWGVLSDEDRNMWRPYFAKSKPARFDP
jgi:hypothetical protein